MSSDKDTWEYFGSNDPYFAVATFDKFRKENLSEDAIADFFRTGDEHVENLWADIEDGFGVKLRPKRALDFGCGVGRIAFALASRCERVIGIDISESMLAEARKNAETKQLFNLKFEVSDDWMHAEDESYDFVHSFIVLQHIEPETGYEIVSEIVARLKPGGIGMLHVTIDDKTPASQKLRLKAYRKFPSLYAVANRLRGRRSSPLMPMHVYELGRMFSILKSHGCEKIYVRPTDHGMTGAMVFFQRSDGGSDR